MRYVILVLTLLAVNYAFGGISQNKNTKSANSSPFLIEKTRGVKPLPKSTGLQVQEVAETENHLSIPSTLPHVVRYKVKKADSGEKSGVFATLSLITLVLSLLGIPLMLLSVIFGAIGAGENRKNRRLAKVCLVVSAVLTVLTLFLLLLFLLVFI